MQEPDSGTSSGGFLIIENPSGFGVIGPGFLNQVPTSPFFGVPYYQALKKVSSSGSKQHMGTLM